MPDAPQRRSSDREPISSEPALVAVLDKREEAERRLEVYVAQRDRDRKRQLYGFLFFITVVVALFFQQREAMHRIEQGAIRVSYESAQRAYILCQSGNDIRRESVEENNEFRTQIQAALMQWASNDGVVSPQDDAVLGLFGEALVPQEFVPESCPPAPSDLPAP